MILPVGATVTSLWQHSLMTAFYWLCVYVHPPTHTHMWICVSFLTNTYVSALETLFPLALCTDRSTSMHRDLPPTCPAACIIFV